MNAELSELIIRDTDLTDGVPTGKDWIPQFMLDHSHLSKAQEIQLARQAKSSDPKEAKAAIRKNPDSLAKLVQMYNIKDVDSDPK
jgi:hypothetical protein